MNSLIAFTKKELTASLRSAKLYILLGVFVLLGAISTITAKVTPILFDMMSEALAASGLNIQSVSATVLDSWLQFFKNISTGLIVFIIVQSNIFTSEYRSGTLTLALTKGLARYKVVISKTVITVLMWTICLWLSFATTYICNTLFWDNSLAKHLLFSMVCWWLHGVYTIILMVFCSTIAKSNIVVLALTGGVAFVFSLVSALPKIDKYLPTMLTDGVSLIYGTAKPQDYIVAINITLLLCVILFCASIPLFNKKQL